VVILHNTKIIQSFLIACYSHQVWSEMRYWVTACVVNRWVTTMTTTQTYTRLITRTITRRSTSFSRPCLDTPVGRRTWGTHSESKLYFLSVIKSLGKTILCSESKLNCLRLSNTSLGWWTLPSSDIYFERVKRLGKTICWSESKLYFFSVINVLSDQKFRKIHTLQWV